MPTISVRVSEGMKAEVEQLTQETGAWVSESNFIREAIDEHIKRYWFGERYCQRPQLKNVKKV
jgi:Arc/MetJ-type ribon-helix-helix transcriptional regulator